MIRGNCFLTVREFADEMGNNMVSHCQIFNKNIETRRVRSKFVPRVLTAHQEQKGVEIS